MPIGAAKAGCGGEEEDGGGELDDRPAGSDARGGEDGFAARVATRAAELRASRAYVPDGLSVEEYAETKLREEDYKKSLDLGAWGPRFKRTAAPGAFGKAWVASFWMGGKPPPPPVRYE